MSHLFHLEICLCLIEWCLLALPDLSRKWTRALGLQKATAATLFFTLVKSLAFLLLPLLALLFVFDKTWRRCRAKLPRLGFRVWPQRVNLSLLPPSMLVVGRKLGH